jgi:hypothetical protein
VEGEDSNGERLLTAGVVDLERPSGSLQLKEDEAQ